VIALHDAYRRKEVWTRDHSSLSFSVQVSRHEEKPDDDWEGCYHSSGPHRWCVYAYIRKAHPHFAAFNGKEEMWQEAATCLHFHGGPSFLQVHIKPDTGEVVCHQVGADYNHLHDTPYTRMAKPEEAWEVFDDAETLFNRLAQMLDGASKEPT
jgi:hypothetical protein